LDFKRSHSATRNSLAGGSRGISGSGGGYSLSAGGCSC
jgi:hypothetical protein